MNATKAHCATNLVARSHRSVIGDLNQVTRALRERNGGVVLVSLGTLSRYS